MGLLHYFGLDDLADSVNEFTTGIDGLKEDIINSVIGPGEELKNTVNDIVSEVNPDENTSN